MFERFAIFYTPGPGAFADFGASWLGWDSARGCTVPHPPIDTVDVAALTAVPRKYGFHATLKAPFRLAQGADLAKLTAATDSFATRHAAVPLGQFTLTATHGFLALRPTCDPAALRRLATAIVTELDGFRAPLSDADIARRRKAGLTPQQDRQMLDWGYPYIFDDFHFHMTLSGALDSDSANALHPVLDRLLAPVVPDAPVLDAITLMGQDTDGMFHHIHRATLSG